MKHTLAPTAPTDDLGNLTTPAGRRVPVRGPAIWETRAALTMILALILVTQFTNNGGGYLDLDQANTHASGPVIDPAIFTALGNACFFLGLLFLALATRDALAVRSELRTLGYHNTRDYIAAHLT